MAKTTFLILFILISQIIFGQSKKEMAMTKAKEAINLMDNGKIDESIKLLEEAIKLDPGKIAFTYELAMAYYLKEDYNESIKILKEVVNRKDVFDQVYSLMGNCYDMLGKSSKAFETYDLGLKKFPNSGVLYLEKGNTYWNKEEYEKALILYEKGIEVDPDFPSNYYRVTKLFCSSSEQVWGMIYGEIFLNLERTSRRTAEISKLLYNTYKSQIEITSDTSISVSFSKFNTIDISNLKNPEKIKLPYGVGVYEPTLMMSLSFKDTIDLNSLNYLRQNFTENYFKLEHDKNYPNVLFEYQNKVKQAGHFEAYNYWILNGGEKAGFENWVTDNKVKWDSFVEWFSKNGLEVNNSNKFYRGQY